MANGRGVILFGIYTGQRLGDIAQLGWDDVDLATDSLAFNSQKTRRRQILSDCRAAAKMARRSSPSKRPVER